jgi:transposase InsO family protein
MVTPPPHGPKANATCERVIGTIRRECLAWLIPLSESHLRSILKSWVGHYNGGRSHMSLGPGRVRQPWMNTAAFIAPALVPLTASTSRVGSSRSRSRTPQ